jgi:hypothetical protein
MQLPLRLPHLSILLAGALCVSAIPAQIGARPPIKPGEFGFSVADSNASAGTLCSGFSCTAATLNTKAGQTLTLSLRAPQNARYFVIIGPAKPALCVTFPGFLNKHVVPVVILLPGVVNQVDRGPRCFGYMDSFSATIPSATAKGTQAAAQALAIVSTANGRTLPAFSSPVNIVVQ